MLQKKAVQPVHSTNKMTYGSKTWALNKEMPNKIPTTQIAIKIAIIGVTRNSKTNK